MAIKAVKQIIKVEIEKIDADSRSVYCKCAQKYVLKKPTNEVRITPVSIEMPENLIIFRLKSPL